MYLFLVFSINSFKKAFCFAFIKYFDISVEEVKKLQKDFIKESTSNHKAKRLQKKMYISHW